MRRLLAIMASILSLCTLPAQQIEDKHDFTARLHAGIYVNNSNAWILEPSVTWQFHRYVGVAAGIEITAQHNQASRSIDLDGHWANLVDNEVNFGWIVFKPSIVLRSPSLIRRNDDIKLWLQAEPGISLACPFHNSLTYEIIDFNDHGGTGNTLGYETFSNKGLEWFYWNARVSLNLELDRWVIGAGYGLSNFDYYSCRRDVTLPGGNKFRVPSRELSHSVFLSLGYRF